MRFEAFGFVVEITLDEGIVTTDALTLDEALDTVARAKAAGYEAPCCSPGRP